jgi:hypothetical protein
MCEAVLLLLQQIIMALAFGVLCCCFERIQSQIHTMD